MSTAAKIEQMIAPTLEAMGYAVVRVKLQGGQRPVLQIMAERETGGEPHDGGFNIDDCTEISRAVSAILDVEDPIPEAYNLEVSSPGLDRPLVKLKDFDRFKGFVARVELGHAHEGRKRFRGRLLGIEGESVKLQDDEGKDATLWSLPHGDITSAKLVLTDELLRLGAAQKAAAEHAAE
ncbi:ribosome maturation factor RimP [Ferrovibrio sp.]|uniref:ribosome maturation factor RimP n=1 Tax=Ferrovibrio sp. TaxID=1917215 RepID=UPI003D14A1B0